MFLFQPKNYAILLACLCFAAIVVSYLPDEGRPPSGNEVILVAKPWNNGAVHLWHSIVEAEATFTDLPDGTRCERLDNHMHKLVGPPPAIYYYRVNCGGIAGYVEVDQVE